MKRFVLAIGVVAAFSTPAYPQDKLPNLIIAVGGPTGTYMTMMKELNEVCKDRVNLELIVSKGSTENLESLVNNRVAAAFVQSDILYAYSRNTAKYNIYQTLVAFHPEEIHVISLRETKVGTRLGLGGREIENLSDLKGLKVGAAGGSVVTSEILAGAGGEYDTIPFANNDEVISALERKQIQAAVIVGGAPLTVIEKLDGRKFKLVPIGDSISNRVDKVYRKASVNYSNLNSGEVPTLAPVAIMITQQYSVPRRQVAQKAFRHCFVEAIEEIKETPRTHTKWRAITAWDRGVGWPWYNLEGDKPQPVPEEKK